MARSPESEPDYPLSLFRQVLRSTFGRVMVFLAICVLGPCLASLILLSKIRDPLAFWGWEIDPMIARILILFPSQVFFGLRQGWGIIADLLIVALFIAYVLRDSRPLFSLPAVLLVVTMERFRCLAMSRNLGFSGIRIAIFLGLWTIGLAVLIAIWVLAHRGIVLKDAPWFEDDDE